MNNEEWLALRAKIFKAMQTWERKGENKSVMAHGLLADRLQLPIHQAFKAAMKARMP